MSSVMPALDTSTSTGPCSASTAAERGVHLLGRGDVAPHAEQAVGRAAAAVGDRDPVAVRGERLGDGQPDAAVAAGDQHGSAHVAHTLVAMPLTARTPVAAATVR